MKKKGMTQQQSKFLTAVRACGAIKEKMVGMKKKFDYRKCMGKELKKS